jgi:hypothetical protein
MRIPPHCSSNMRIGATAQYTQHGIWGGFLGLRPQISRVCDAIRCIGRMRRRSLVSAVDKPLGWEPQQSRLAPDRRVTRAQSADKHQQVPTLRGPKRAWHSSSSTASDPYQFRRLGTFPTDCRGTVPVRQRSIQRTDPNPSRERRFRTALLRLLVLVCGAKFPLVSRYATLRAQR